MSENQQTQSSHWAKDEAEEDRIESLIRKSDCWSQHLSVVDCMSEKKDWRQCQEVLNGFKQCMLISQKEKGAK